MKGPSRVVLVLLLAGIAAVASYRLVEAVSHTSKDAVASQRQAFEAWRQTAVPAILEYRHAIDASPISSRPRRVLMRATAQAEQAHIRLTRLAMTIRSGSTAKTAELRRLDAMLAYAATLAADAEAGYATALRLSHPATLRRARIQLEHSAAVMFSATLRANAIGTQLYHEPLEG